MGGHDGVARLGQAGGAAWAAPQPGSWAGGMSGGGGAGAKYLAAGGYSRAAAPQRSPAGQPGGRAGLPQALGGQHWGVVP